MIQVFRDIGNTLFPEGFSSVVTIGNFDGFHLGHRALLQTLQERARKYGVDSVVVTFSPHPTQVLYPEKSSQRMFDGIDQNQILEELGIDVLIEETFTKAYAELSPEEFFINKIYKKLNPRALVVGYDFCFGRNRAGNLNKLAELCQQVGIEFVVEPAFLWQGSPISSSRIRESLRSGDVRSAWSMLGRPYYFSGEVKKGAQRGGLLGIPTANIYPPLEFVPHQGVYVSRTFCHGRVFESITNFGVNPTFPLSKNVQMGQNLGEGHAKVETHIFNFSEDIYGQNIKVELLDFLRPEMKFAGVENLIEQIHKDIVTAKKILLELNENCRGSGS